MTFAIKNYVCGWLFSCVKNVTACIALVEEMSTLKKIQLAHGVNFVCGEFQKSSYCFECFGGKSRF